MMSGATMLIEPNRPCTFFNNLDKPGWLVYNSATGY